MTWTPSRKRTVAAVAAVMVAVAMTLAIRLMAADRIMETLRSEASRRSGLDVRAHDVSLSLLRGNAVFEGFRVLDGTATVFEAERIEMEGGVLDLLRARFDRAKLSVLRPVLRITVEEGGGTNLQRFRALALAAEATGDDGIMILGEGTIEGGRIEFLDAITDPDLPLRLEVRGLRGSVRDWPFSGEPASGSSTEYRVDGEIPQPDFPARFSVVAWGAPPGGPSGWTLLAAITGFDLRLVPQYVGAMDRTALGGDFLHVAVDVRTLAGVIGPGEIVGEVAGTGTVLPMLVGGTTVKPVFDAESPLATLLRLPLTRIGNLGAVALDAGWSAVRGGGRAAADVAGGVVDAGASLGSGLLNAGGELLEGDPIGALAGAGEGALGVVTSIGGGLLDGAASLFGGGADAVHALAGENPEELRRRFDERHAARRLVMLRMARASAIGPEAQERRSRIDVEIEAASGPPGPALPG